MVSGVNLIGLGLDLALKCVSWSVGVHIRADKFTVVANKYAKV